MKQIYTIIFFAMLLSAVSVCAQIPDSVYRYFPIDSNESYWIYECRDVLNNNQVVAHTFYEIIGDTLTSSIRCKKVEYAEIDENVDGHGHKKTFGPRLYFWYIDTLQWTVNMSLNDTDKIDSFGVFVNLKKDSDSIASETYFLWGMEGSYALRRNAQTDVRGYDVWVKNNDGSKYRSGNYYLQKNVGISFLGTGLTDLTFRVIGYQTEYGRSGMTEDQFWNEFNSVGVGEALPPQSQFFLYQNYPNPLLANGKTMISYFLPRTEEISLKVYNIYSQEVAALVQERQDEGYHRVSFSPATMTSGVYFYELRTHTERLIKQMVILK